MFENRSGEASRLADEGFGSKALSPSAVRTFGDVFFWLDSTDGLKRRMKVSDLGVRVNAMQEFIRQQNIAKFGKLLETTSNEIERRTLMRLLAEQEAKAPSPRNVPDGR
jgi:hypothetical protein